MSSFKEIGQYSETRVPDNLRQGGIPESLEFSVRPVEYRIRPLSQQGSVSEVSEHDLSPILLKPSELADISIPQIESLQLGMETEFNIIDNQANPANLYGDDFIYPEGSNIKFSNNGTPWILDSLNASPECLRFQVELNACPDNNPFQVIKTNLRQQQDLIANLEAHELLLLPTGLSGYKLEKSWSNVPPHPYVAAIHQHSIGKEGSAFDGMSLQHHVDLKPYGGNLDHALYIGNSYNNLLASMLAALSTSSPFWRGEITPNFSNREYARNKLKTRGGIQAVDYPIDGEGYLAHANRLIKAGAIPVPERAGSYADRIGNGSHRDFRPKISLGTAEFGSCDMHPNPLLNVANIIILRKFVHKISEDYEKGIPLPKFLEPIEPIKRVNNRVNANKFGNNSRFLTATGTYHISELWQDFFTWIAGANAYDHDIAFAESAVNMALDRQAPLGRNEHALEDYFDPRKPETFLRGNFATVMKEHASSCKGSRKEVIRQTNLAIANNYKNFISSGNCFNLLE